MSLLDFLKFEPKSQRLVADNILDSTPLVIQASIIGSEIVIKDLTQGKWLYHNGNYGNFVGHRMDFVNNKCFSNNLIDEPINDVPYKSKFNCSDSNINVFKVKSEDKIFINFINEKVEKTWLVTKHSSNYLFLSLIEALYLLELDSTLNQSNFCNKINNINIAKFQIKNFHSLKEFYFFICQTIISRNELEVFIKRYAIYRHFRRLNWVVRDGLSFGVDFLLYKDNIEKYHSSAAVRLIDENFNLSEDKVLIALQRELVTCKKTLILAKVNFNLNKKEFEIMYSLDDLLNNLTVKLTLCNSWHCNQSRLIDL